MTDKEDKMVTIDGNTAAAHVAHAGLRRRVQWTETGLGNLPLRDGEPAYYEQRWLQDWGQT